MTAVVAPPSPAGDGPGGDGGSRWVLVEPGSSWLACGQHAIGSGHVDERDRRLSHEELGVAELFTSAGHDVRSLPEFRRGGRRADLDVCGASVEVKSFLPLGERDGPPSPQSVANKLLKAVGQSDAVVLYGKGSGLTAGAVRSGLARLAADGRAGSLSAVRAVGDGFDLAWVRRPTIGRDLRPQGAQVQPPRPQLGL